MTVVPGSNAMFNQNRPHFLPFGKNNVQNYLPLIPFAIEQLDLDEYDIVFSSSHIASKGVLTSPMQLHISYVHSFGNQLSPVPYEIKYENLNEYAGRTTFHYTSGATSMSRVIGNANYVTVQNEFHLPDTTVTRVFAGNIVKTIITHCYPIGKNESILHYDLYRNFLTPSLFDILLYKQMDITLHEDVNIINYIYDDYVKGFMNTKFDVTQLKFREKWNKKFIDQEKYNKNK